MQNIAPQELSNWLNDTSRAKPLLLDVREPWEFELCHLPDSALMPMNTVAQRIQEIDSQRDIICICHHGGRSMRVAMLLEQQGFTHLFNLTGGVHAWAQQVDPSMATY